MILITNKNTEQHCFICGNNFRLPKAGDITNLREMKICSNCGAATRQNNLAQTLLKIIKTNASCLEKAKLDINRLKIYILESYGPIVGVLRRSKSVICSEFWDDVTPGTLVDGVRCEDVQNLTFSNDSFDIVISQDVFEHVPNPEIGFKEIYRVLKPGGYHLFTVPYNGKLSKSITRALVEKGKINHILPPTYHSDALRPEGALVYTDFGLDFIEMLRCIGFNVEIIEFKYVGYEGGWNIVFISKK